MMDREEDQKGGGAPQAAVRLDKWLWAARFFKTRSLAHQAIELGRVRTQGARIKPAHFVRVGEDLEIALGDARVDVVVRALSTQRGPAPIARGLYDETPASVARREQRQRVRAQGPDPAVAIKGRPTKKEGRELRRLRGGDT
jgi:ribosome-associated heat shock protein Hsp15